MSRPTYHAQVETCVDDTLKRVGPEIILATPLGLGKPVQLLNEFYRRAVENPDISLTILTALSLAPPRAGGDLQGRLVGPLVERIFGGYPTLNYLEALRDDSVPENVAIEQFYFSPGRFLGSPRAQQSYTCSNYSHVARDALDRGVNVICQLIAPRPDSEGGAGVFSLSCNPDLTPDVAPEMRRRAREEGREVAVLGQVNSNLPFMTGPAAVPEEFFDAIVQAPEVEFPLFGPPSVALDTAAHLIGLRASALIKDGGTLQLGIGDLGDAVAHGLILRHTRNDDYQNILRDIGVVPENGPLVNRIGGTGPFERGIYANSEMLVDAFLSLYEAGILERRVYDDARIQRLLDAGELSERVTPETVTTLLKHGIVDRKPSEAQIARLTRLGILRPDVRIEGDALRIDSETVVPADLDNPETRTALFDRGLGDALRGGVLAHGGFFLGPQSFYDAFREMPPSERALFAMTRISYVNRLYGREELKRAQRRHARFLNTTMKATLLGSVASDALQDGRVVSGVGGQYNFVAMAHALEDGRSILFCRSTRTADGDVTSNIRWRYAHCTIPRHLRDILITEYGIADLRGKSDEEVVKAMLAVTDARFQRDLADEAKAGGKLSGDYRLPDRIRRNTPDHLETMLRPHREAGLLPEFPFGTDLTDEEVVLIKALDQLNRDTEHPLSLVPNLEELGDVFGPPESSRPYLERMGLADPETMKERLLQKTVLYALSRIDAI